MTKALGIGVDLEKIGRFKKLITDESWLDRVFLPAEQRYCQSYKAKSLEKFAGGFVAKEAVVKALCQAGDVLVDYRQVEVIREKNKPPKVRLHNMNFKGTFLLSISHSQTDAFAVCLVV